MQTYANFAAELVANPIKTIVLIFNILRTNQTCSLKFKIWIECQSLIAKYGVYFFKKTEFADRVNVSSEWNLLREMKIVREK